MQVHNVTTGCGHLRQLLATAPIHTDPLAIFTLGGVGFLTNDSTSPCKMGHHARSRQRFLPDAAMCRFYSRTRCCRIETRCRRCTLCSHDLGCGWSCLSERHMVPDSWGTISL